MILNTLFDKIKQAVFATWRNSILEIKWKRFYFLFGQTHNSCIMTPIRLCQLIRSYMGILHAKFQGIVIWGLRILYGFYAFYCFRDLKGIENERNLAFLSKDRSRTFFFPVLTSWVRFIFLNFFQSFSRFGLHWEVTVGQRRE